MGENQLQDLIARAISARANAYCPYSNYQVGAALLGGSGAIYVGCNVENASYGLTICAERSAAVAAISQGEREFKAIAIATADGGAPCGACRQFLSEFGPEMAVIVVNGSGEITLQVSLSDLLPNAFFGKR